MFINNACKGTMASDTDLRKIRPPISFRFTEGKILKSPPAVILNFKKVSLI